MNRAKDEAFSAALATGDPGQLQVAQAMADKAGELEATLKQIETPTLARALTATGLSVLAAGPELAAGAITAVGQTPIPDELLRIIAPAAFRVKEPKRTTGEALAEFGGGVKEAFTTKAKTLLPGAPPLVSEEAARRIRSGTLTTSGPVKAPDGEIIGGTESEFVALQKGAGAPEKLARAVETAGFAGLGIPVGAGIGKTLQRFANFLDRIPVRTIPKPVKGPGRIIKEMFGERPKRVELPPTERPPPLIERVPPEPVPPELRPTPTPEAPQDPFAPERAQGFIIRQTAEGVEIIPRKAAAVEVGEIAGTPVETPPAPPAPAAARTELGQQAETVAASWAARAERYKVTGRGPAAGRGAGRTFTDINIGRAESRVKRMTALAKKAEEGTFTAAEAQEIRAAYKGLTPGDKAEAMAATLIREPSVLERIKPKASERGLAEQIIAEAEAPRAIEQPKAPTVLERIKAPERVPEAKPVAADIETPKPTNVERVKDAYALTDAAEEAKLIRLRREQAEIAVATFKKPEEVKAATTREWGGNVAEASSDIITDGKMAIVKSLAREKSTADKMSLAAKAAHLDAKVGTRIAREIISEADKNQIGGRTDVMGFGSSPTGKGGGDLVFVRDGQGTVHAF